MTWDPVDANTERLRLAFSGGAVEGPSPLSLETEVPAGKSTQVTVEGIEEGAFVRLPAQPFHAVAVQT